MNKKVMRLATPGKRLGAYAIDAVVPFILAIIILIAIISVADRSSSFEYGYGYGLDYNFNMGSTVGSVVLIVVSVLLVLVYLGIQVYFFTKSKTIGKAILGLQVVSSKDGSPLSIGYMILREWFAKKASGSVFLLGYIWVLIDEKNRGWHDKIIDSYVIECEEISNQDE